MNATNLSREREKAIEILEAVEDTLGESKLNKKTLKEVFQGESWYELEDLVTEILERGN